MKLRQILKTGLAIYGLGRLMLDVADPSELEAQIPDTRKVVLKAANYFLNRKEEVVSVEVPVESKADVDYLTKDMLYCVQQYGQATIGDLSDSLEYLQNGRTYRYRLPAAYYNLPYEQLNAYGWTKLKGYIGYRKRKRLLKDDYVVIFPRPKRVTQPISR